MFEDDEPGELPLMRNLHAIKQPKHVRDSPSTKTWSRKSPLLESMSSIPLHESNIDSLEAFQHDPGLDHDIAFQHGGRRTRKDVSWGMDSGKHTHAGSPVSRGLCGSLHKSGRNARMGSMHVNNSDSRMSWDLGREVPSTVDAVASDEYMQQNTRRQEHKEVHKSSCSGSHERRAMDRVSSSVAEDLKSNDMWNWTDLQDTSALDSHRGFFTHHHDKDGRLRAMQKASNLEKGHKLWSQTDQALSPLVLNLNNEMHRSAHVNSSFTLEEPTEVEDEHDGKEKDWQSLMLHQMDTPSNTKMGRTSHDMRRSHRKHATSIPEIERPPQILESRNSGRHRYPEYSRPAPSESEFFEYEVEALELPTYKDSRKLLQKSKFVNQGKGHAVENVRTRSPAMESLKGMRKKLVVGVAHQTGQAAWTPEGEPLPLLTELEDYNGSDEFGGTSIDGELARLSISEPHGELELVACHVGALDRSNAGRLLKVADTDRLQLSVQDCKELTLCNSKPRNLSQKYRPRAFEEVIGQHIVAQALSNAIVKGKIAPVYLFQGSRGTGKTSVARIFASALICVSSEGQQPCGVCRECVGVATGKCSEVREVDAASNNGVERVKALLEETISAPPLLRYKVFIIDECHVLTTETWNALLKILEEPPMNVVFILITTDVDRLPRTVVSRCQKFPFPKVKDSEIVKRLQKLAALEDLAVDPETLHLIASRSDGSLRDAETILDQVSLLGQRINSSTVHELVGSVSDERILGLLDSALVADTISTVRRARELVDSGIEPLSLMSRLATLITDILAGSFKFSDKQRRGFFWKRSLSGEKLERLRIAMKTLSEAEKQLRTSNDRTTWLIAALLQLGPDHSFMSCMGTSVTQSPIALDENEAVDFEHRSSGRQTWADGDANVSQNLASEFVPINNKSDRDSYGVQERAHWTKEYLSQEPLHGKALPDKSSTHAETLSKPFQGLEKPDIEIEFLDESIDLAREQRLSPSKLNDIWCKVLERCQSNPLRQLLHTSVKLISISISEVDAVVHLEVSNSVDNASCCRSQKRIASLFEMVLGFPVEIKMTLASLPAEAESSQGAEDRSSSTAGHQSRVHPHAHDLSSSKGYEWENPRNPMKPQGLKHSNAAESFPAIPQGALPLKENMGCDSASTMWNKMPSQDIRRWLGHQETIGMDASRDSQEARGLSASKALAPGGIVSSGGYTQHQVSHNNVHGEVNGFYDDVKGHISEEDRELDEMGMLSLEFNETDDPHDKAWPRHSAYEEPMMVQSYSIEGRRSSDVDLQKRKGSHLSMVRRLSMRSRIRSLPSSDPNSPDQGLRYVAAKGNTNQSPEGKAEGHHAGEDCEVQVHAEMEEISAATQKKGKLKGGFARFFQGKHSKQGTDQ